MTPSQRLVLNTATTYGRSIIVLLLTLFSSRWVLNSLGEVDYGLFSLVGSVIVFITFLNTVMASSVSRHYAYSLGQNDSDEMIKMFNTSVSIHFCFAIILVLIGWPVGEYLIENLFNIPVERLSTSLWVFRASLISAFFSMASVPFVGMFTAQQRMAEMAIWGILQAVLTFMLSYFLTIFSGNALLFYAVGMVSIIIFIQLFIISRAFSIFRECRIVTSEWFHVGRFKKILSFAIWNLIGSTGAIFRDQGSAVILNIYFGPVANAAYGIARQVSSQANQLSAAMLGAFSPELTASEGRGDRQRMLKLAHWSSKVGTILVMFFAIPLIAEIDYILKLWLHMPPEYTATLCQLILCSFLIDRLSTGYMMAVNAYGKIAAYQLTVGGILLCTLPLIWIFIWIGYPPSSVGIAFLIISVVCTIGRVIWIHILFKESILIWLNIVFKPCFSVAMFSMIAAILPHFLMKPSIIRLISTLLLSFFATIVSTWFFAFNSNEHEFIRANFRKLLGKITQVDSRG